MAFEPVGDCNCLACVLARGRIVKNSSYVWDIDRFAFPYQVGEYEVPVIYTKEQPVEKAMAKDFSGTYRFNYSIVDEYGHGADYSVVLAVQTRPEDEFQEFMRLVANNVRWHLIEYFMVRWENGEYVRV